jgi:protein TonB
VALAGVLLVQLGLGLVLFRGLQVHAIPAPGELVNRLIDVTLPPPPPVVPPKQIQPAKAVPKHKAAAPAPRQPNPGGSPGPAPHGKAIVPKIAVPAPAAAPAGGGRGTGASIGNGSGGGSGEGEGDGGADLEKIAGDIYNSDYPPNLANAGIGGRVSAEIDVGTDGRVTGCRITRSSGNAQLDSLTCRLIEQRYRFRPSTDRYGRPIADEADVDQDWIPPR